jgi:hypothetical protein
VHKIIIAAKADFILNISLRRGGGGISRHGLLRRQVSFLLSLGIVL